MNYNAKSKDLTIGLELELQIINPKTHNLEPKAKQFIRDIQNGTYKDLIKPEITQSMIEVNSSVHYKVSTLNKELFQITNYLNHIARKNNVVICGGGTHPFQDWSEQKIYPSQRFRNVAKKYGYLAKRFTIFSMHMHVGCSQPDRAIQLVHYLSRYVPQLITLSASSPFYNGVQTGYDSTRSNVVNAFPLSGHMPVFANWSEYMQYYRKMETAGIIQSSKDFYWDIRPKAEFGTVEIRVCDMPLTLSKAATLAAYIQTIAHYLLNSELNPISNDYYQTYMHNRFQAARFGFDGDFVDPFTYTNTTVREDILKTLKLLRVSAKTLGTSSYLRQIKLMALTKYNDANRLKLFPNEDSVLFDIVKEKCRAWKHSLKIA